MKFRIACPSRGRANNVRTTKVLPEITIYCPESEAEEYRNWNTCEVIGVPDHIKGIVPTRQYILDNNEEVFMVDDDIMGTSCWNRGSERKQLVKDVGFLLDRILFIRSMAKQMGCYMYGFGNKTQPMQYKEFKPFSLTGYICGSFMGFLKGHGLSYDLSYTEGDYYISCLNLYKHRKMFIDERYRPATFGNYEAEGGCQLYRTTETMDIVTKKLMLDFGESIVYKKPKPSKKKVRANERSLKILI